MTTCPTCNRPLPATDAEILAAIERAEPATVKNLCAELAAVNREIRPEALGRRLRRLRLAKRVAREDRGFRHHDGRYVFSVIQPQDRISR